MNINIFKLSKKIKFLKTIEFLPETSTLGYNSSNAEKKNFF